MKDKEDKGFQYNMAEGCKIIGVCVLACITLPFSIFQVKPGHCHIVCNRRITHLIFYIEASQVKRCTQLSHDLLFIPCYKLLSKRHSSQQVNCFNYGVQVEYKNRSQLHHCKEHYIQMSEEQLQQIASMMTLSSRKIGRKKIKIPQILCFASIPLQQEPHFSHLFSQLKTTCNLLIRKKKKAGGGRI